MTNDVWAWIIREREGAWGARKRCGLEGAQKQTPGWCFSRFGKSSTALADGREIFIGGEHEDHYDEDFFIYNDVVVKNANGAISIYGYPTDIFPPTDFHSATLVGDDIYIVGCIGYPKQRRNDDTPVFVLNTKTCSIRPFATHGSAPGWLNRHKAELSPENDAIIFERGEIEHAATNYSIDNIDAWRLCLKSGEWSRLTHIKWPRWALTRDDESRNELWHISSLEKADRSGRRTDFDKRRKQKFAERGHKPDLDLYRKRYAPPLDHDALPEEKYRNHRINIDGVVVQYKETSYAVFVTVEGDLPTEKIAVLKTASVETFSAIEGVPYKVVELS